MAVFVISWGIAQYGLIFPHSTLSAWLFRDVFVLPYMQMFVDLHSQEVLQAPPYDMLGAEVCTDDPQLYSNYTLIRCSDKSTNWIALLFLMGYLLITNLLLFNLLIAIFSQTFAKVQGILIILTMNLS